MAETYLAKFGLIQITLPMIQGKEKINATKNGEKGESIRTLLHIHSHSKVLLGIRLSTVRNIGSQ